MDSKERELLIEKVKTMTPEQLEKVLIFIMGLEAGSSKCVEVSAQYENLIN